MTQMLTINIRERTAEMELSQVGAFIYLFISNTALLAAARLSLLWPTQNFENSHAKLK